MSTKKRRIAILAALLLVYVGSYIVLSRRGFARANEWDAPGFHYLAAADTDVWRWGNRSLMILYYPLWIIDYSIGTGRPMGGEPMWRLSSTSKL